MGAAVILLFLMGTTALAATRPRHALLLAVFLAPWNGVWVDFGLTISAYQLVLLPLCLITLARTMQPGWRSAPIAAGGLLLAFVLYVVVRSELQIGFLPDASVGGSALRGPAARGIIQIVLFLFVISPVWLMASMVRRADQLQAFWRTYIISAIVLALIGWVQLILWYGTGTNPLPVGIVSSLLGGSDAFLRQGSFDFASLAIYRMNSLAGEPRNLGVALVFAMLLIQAAALTLRRPPVLQLALAWLFLLVSTVATYSTSAALVWVIGSAVQLPAGWLFGARIRRSPLSIGAALAVVALPIGLAIAAGEARGIPVLQLLSERTVQRLDESGAIEDFDLAILDFLKDQPEYAVAGVGLGNAHLYATPYLNPLFALYAEGNVFTAKTAYMRLISEVGVIGLLLFLAWYTRLVVVAGQALRSKPELAAVVLVGAMTLVVYFATGQIAAEFWMTAGVMTAAIATSRRPQGAPVAGPVPANGLALPA